MLPITLRSFETMYMNFLVLTQTHFHQLHACLKWFLHINCNAHMLYFMTDDRFGN